MLKHIRLLLLITLFPLATLAQNASNIRVSVDQTIKKMVIEYDLKDIQPADSLYVLIETATGQIIAPKAITGAIGKGLQSGNNQAAYWDVIRDNARINGTIQARVQFVRPAPVPVATPAVVAAVEKPKQAVKKEPEFPTKPASPVVVVQKKSPVPILGYIATGGLGIYSFVLTSAISKDSQTYNSKEFVTTTAEKAQYDDMLSSLKSRKSTLTLVAGTAIVVGIATTIYTIVHKPKSTRISLISPPGLRSTNLGVAYSF